MAKKATRKAPKYPTWGYRVVCKERGRASFPLGRGRKLPALVEAPLAECLAVAKKTATPTKRCCVFTIDWDAGPTPKKVRCFGGKKR
jgi:hypothetical protein